jgi:hypothetical protein
MAVPTLVFFLTSHMCLYTVTNCRGNLMPKSSVLDRSWVMDQIYRQAEVFGVGKEECIYLVVKFEY